MAKKKNKQIIRPWCWYCEREFEDEKVLMQHQKAKHFKCNLCPRRLNTAGGLAVHIQQVHKLEPENLPRIENALPGRDGYEVEIFGMEGIPAPDVADYKRRKEIELGLNPGTISQPQAKRPKIENRPLSEDELKAQLAAHRALMGAAEGSAPAAPEASGGAVYGAPPQAYAAPPMPAGLPPPMAGTPGVPPGMLGAPPPFMPGMPPPGFPHGQPPFQIPGMPPGPPPPGFPLAPPFPGAPPGMLPPGMLPPGVRPPFPPPPHFVPPGGSVALPPTFVPATAVPAIPHVSNVPSLSTSAGVTPSLGAPTPAPAELKLPDPSLAQTLPPFKKPTELKWSDPNFSPDERRSVNPKYYFPKNNANQSPGFTAPPSSTGAPPIEEMRGKKRARAEDFL